jgi:hypothetical protein
MYSHNAISQEFCENNYFLVGPLDNSAAFSGFAISVAYSTVVTIVALATTLRN